VFECIQGNDKLFQTLEKKKTCNPMWAETFVTHVDNPFKPITFQVYDKDIVGSDDFMGQVDVELQELNLMKEEELHLELNDGGNEDLIKKNKTRKKLGSVNLRITMKPMTKEEMNEVLFYIILGFSFIDIFVLT
jgi:Ca2+-dependent lipid-binding protein